MNPLPVFVAPAESYPGRSRFEAELMWHGRDEGPRLLWDWWHREQIPRDEFKRLLPVVWLMAEWPSSALGNRRWLEMFKSAGFVSDYEADPPTEPVTAYRGADERHMRGLSWSTDAERAAWFARRWSLLKADVHVFEVTVPSGFVLAHLVGRNEAELVINGFRLRGRFTPQTIQVPDRRRIEVD
jgi:hypothetical protein